jgi:hypothetical protein
METAKLLEAIEQDASPVRPLLKPWMRTWLWLAAGGAYLAAVVAMMGLRQDIVAKLDDGRYLVEQAASLLTALAAAAAAFASVIPGASRKVLILPLLFAAVWLASLGHGCFADWLNAGSSGIVIKSDWMCFPAIVVAGAGPVVLMIWLLKRGAPLTPHLSVALAGLGAAGLGNFGLRLFHVEDAAIMVLIWQFGSVAVLTAFAGYLGGRVLPWQRLAEGT